MKPSPRLHLVVCWLTFMAIGSLLSLNAAGPRVLPEGKLPNDVRLQPPKDLDGYFPFTPPESKAEWQRRADFVRRQILVSQGLWPMPTKTPLHAVIHGKIEMPDYTVEKAYFESIPGFFVTGNLYRPKGKTGKVPAVLVAHGHWRDARFFEETDEKFREELATGAERFDDSGRNRFQAMCVQLARMGCVVWQWDTLGNSDSQQLSFELVHRFARQRPEMNTAENWGFFSAPAEAHLQSIMGLHTLNSIRSLDFVLGLPDVDPARVAVTGASGGATQVLMASAIDPRIALSFPAVMVSTAMQGGCTCENASLLRVGTGNVEIAALFAPKPLGMTSANDWTKEMATKGFPELREHFARLGAADKVMLHRGEHFPHNYNAVSRSAFYTWLNRHFELGAVSPVVERDYRRLQRAELTVWDAPHPAPKASGDDFERSLLRWLREDADRQIASAMESRARFTEIAGGGVEAIIGRTFATAGKVQWVLVGQTDRETYVEMTGLVRNRTHGEELPAVWLSPKQANGRAVIWLDGAGKAGLYTGGGALRPEVRRLIDAGVVVLGVDLMAQGEFLAGGHPVRQTRVVANPREVPAYTFGYNHALFAQRVHDVLSVLGMVRGAEGERASPKSVELVGLGEMGPIAIAARAVGSVAIDRAAVDAHGFRFGQVLDYRDPNFLPGGAKYGDLPGMLILGGTTRLWLAGEPVPAAMKTFHAAAGAPNAVTVSSRHDSAAVVDWLLAP